MYTLKSIARRGSMLAAAAVVVAATALPSAVFADALNPLTERSLLLTSSSPGYQNTDGSNNTETIYAPPGSGPNGQKTGQTFSFRVSTDSVAESRPIEAFTLQYCTTAAGICRGPGNNAGDARVPDRLSNAAAFANETADLDVVYGTPVAGTDFEVWMDGVNVSTGWTMTTSNVEDNSHPDALTGKNNFITLANATGISPEALDEIRIVFNASTTQYITNPGDGAFFVRMNTYDSDQPTDHIPTVPAETNTSIINGGVTVANVMTDSIHIVTKVLETMSFSVGTENRDTQELTNPDVHGTCDPIIQANNNMLNLGNPSAEYSLEVGTAWDVFSYWRLSSNSSGGATVYYSGETLANTVGDVIAPIGATAATSLVGTEQFGLAFTDSDIQTEVSTSFDTAVTGDPTRFRLPGLYTLTAEANYDGGNGTINGVSPTAEFAFLRTSLTEPVVIAQDDDEVISCSTAKMRYIANIGADTPAGIYATKINYLAAPQY